MIAPHTEGDADGLIWMLSHGLVSRLSAYDCLLTNAAIEFLAVFQRGGETLASHADFFSRHVGGGGHQRVRIFGQLAHIMAGCLCFLANPDLRS